MPRKKRSGVFLARRKPVNVTPVFCHKMGHLSATVKENFVVAMQLIGSKNRATRRVGELHLSRAQLAALQLGSQWPDRSKMKKAVSQAAKMVEENLGRVLHAVAKYPSLYEGMSLVMAEGKARTSVNLLTTFSTAACEKKGRKI